MTAGGAPPLPRAEVHTRVTPEGHPCTARGTTATGTAVDPRNLAWTFSRVAKRAEVEGASLHSLRHSAALAMRDAGMPLVTVSRILGHAPIAVTADLYRHVSEAGRRSAVEAIGAAYGL